MMSVILSVFKEEHLKSSRRIEILSVGLALLVSYMVQKTHILNLKPVLDKALWDFSTRSS